MYYIGLLLLNIFGIVGLLVLPKDAKREQGQFGLWLSILIFFYTLCMYKSFLVVSTNGELKNLVWMESYIWFEPLLFEYHLNIDWLSYYLLVLSTFLIPVCILGSWESVQKDWKGFLILLYVMEFFLINVFLVLDLFMFYIFFEGILIPMFLIIGIWGSRERKIHAAYQFFFYTLAGSLLMLLGIIYIYVEKGSSNLLVLYEIPFTKWEEYYLWIAFFISFAIKVPMVPVHIWLPEAHVEAPTAGSVLLAGILLKLGGYGMIRFLIGLFPEASIYFQPLVFLLSILGIYYSSLSTIRQIDLKKIIAYSSIGHMNYVVVGLFSMETEGMVGSYYMMLSHGFVSSGLFLCIGFLYERYHSRNLFDYGGLVQLMPLYSSVIFILVFANFGFPGTSSFIGEFLILVGISKANQAVFLLGAIGLLLSTVYSIWFLNRLVFGPLSLKVEENVDLNMREGLLLLLVIFFVIYLGLCPSKVLTTIEYSIEQW